MDTSTLKICVICCSGFNSASTVKSDAILCREHLVTFCKLLANSPPRQTPEFDALLQKSFPGMDAFFEESGMSVCVDCHHQITVAMEKGTVAEKKEEEIRKLQLQILQQMKELQKQVDEFHDEMTKVEKTIQTSDVSCLMYHMAKNPNKNEDATNGIVLIRDRILDVMADLRDFQARQNTVLNVEQLLALQAAAMAENLDDDDDFVPFIPPPEVIVGTEGLLEAANIAPMFFGHTIFSTEGDFRFEASAKNNGVKGDSDYSKSDDEPDSSDSDLEPGDAPFELPYHHKQKLEPTKSKSSKQPAVIDIESGFNSAAAIAIRPSLRKELIERCLNRDKNRRKEDDNSLDPIIRYPLSYNQTTDKFTISNKEILIDDKDRTMKCLQCGVVFKERSKSSLDLEWRMKVHVVSMHIGFNCTSPGCSFKGSDHGQFIRHIRSFHHKNNNRNINAAANASKRNQQVEVVNGPVNSQFVTVIHSTRSSRRQSAAPIQQAEKRRAPSPTPTPPKKQARKPSSSTSMRMCPVSNCKEMFSKKEDFIRHLQGHRNKLQKERPKPKPVGDCDEPELVILD